MPLICSDAQERVQNQKPGTKGSFCQEKGALQVPTEWGKGQKLCGRCSPAVERCKHFAAVLIFHTPDQAARQTNRVLFQLSFIWHGLTLQEVKENLSTPSTPLLGPIELSLSAQKVIVQSKTHFGLMQTEHSWKVEFPFVPPLQGEWKAARREAGGREGGRWALCTISSPCCLLCSPPSAGSPKGSQLRPCPWGSSPVQAVTDIFSGKCSEGSGKKCWGDGVTKPEPC